MATTKQVIRATSLTGGGDCGAPSLVDVNDGVIIRIRPLHHVRRLPFARNGLAKCMSGGSHRVLPRP